MRRELRRGLPVGFVWGEQDGEVRFHPDESVVHTIRTVFEKFTELGSVRKVWLWFRCEGLSFPTRKHMKSEIRWVTPTYTAIHAVLTNPVYAGAYTYGKFHREQYVDDQGRLRKRSRLLPMAEWPVLLRQHHLGYIDWATFQANQIRIDSNVHPEPHHAGGAVREGAALLQGLATCGKCGRRLHTHYTGRNAAPGYHCAGKDIVSGRGVYCLSTCSLSSALTSIGIAPAEWIDLILSGCCVVAVTVCPALTSMGSNRLPMAPVAPAKKIFIFVLL
ncbi:MAG: recombinase family protein [Candidatus Sulfotelmatobacter sp.]